MKGNLNFFEISPTDQQFKSIILNPAVEGAILNERAYF